MSASVDRLTELIAQELPRVFAQVLPNVNREELLPEAEKLAAALAPSVVLRSDLEQINGYDARGRELEAAVGDATEYWQLASALQGRCADADRRVSALEQALQALLAVYERRVGKGGAVPAAARVLLEGP